MQENKLILVEYNSPVATGEPMRITLRIANSFGYANDVKILFNRNGEPPGKEKRMYLTYDSVNSKDGVSCFTGIERFTTPGYRTFVIQLRLNGITKEIRYDQYSDRAVISNDSKFEYWKTFVYYSFFETPDWIKGGNMYQIFVDTFYSENLPEHLKDKVVSWCTLPKWKPDLDGTYRNDQFYGGNLRGIITKLPYIKTLGTTVIYLTPIFKSPSSNRYDTIDYLEIDEMVGTWEDLDELHKKANELGMHLVVDVVFNHSSSENKLLKEDPDLYDWHHKYTEPKCWWGFKNLVEFNKYHERYFHHLAIWLDKYQGYMDGIRLDVADSLPDFVLKFIREHFPKYILGEVWKHAIIGEFREFFYGDELDATMNYLFANAIYRYIRCGNWRYLKQTVRNIMLLYPPQALDACPIFLTSHDVPRKDANLVGEFMKNDERYENNWDIDKDPYWNDANGKFDTLKFRTWEAEHDMVPTGMEEIALKSHMLAVFMQYTFPGLPSTFAGDEAGVWGYKDPFNRKPFPWGKENKKLYAYYCKMGAFRAAHVDLFSNSKNFKLTYADEKLAVYTWGEYTMIVNVSYEDIVLDVKYAEKDVIFATADNHEKGVLRWKEGIVIK